jgi:hypothetical protein
MAARLEEAAPARGPPWRWPRPTRLIELVVPRWPEPGQLASSPATQCSLRSVRERWRGLSPVSLRLRTRLTGST